MKRKRGQALVEFVIILPIFIFLLLVIFDFGKIIMIKNRLENEMNNITEEYKKKQDEETIKKILKKNSKNAQLEIKKENDDIHIKLTEKTEIITPGLNLILTSPYEVVVERSILT